MKIVVYVINLLIIFANLLFLAYIIVSLYSLTSTEYVDIIFLTTFEVLIFQFEISKFESSCFGNGREIYCFGCPALLCRAKGLGNWVLDRKEGVLLDERINMWSNHRCVSFDWDLLRSSFVRFHLEKKHGKGSQVVGYLTVRSISNHSSK